MVSPPRSKKAIGRNNKRNNTFLMEPTRWYRIHSSVAGKTIMKTYGFMEIIMKAHRAALAHALLRSFFKKKIASILAMYQHMAVNVNVSLRIPDPQKTAEGKNRMATASCHFRSG